MQIYFTQHAKERVVQRGLNTEELIDEITRMPDFEGLINWVTKHGDKLVLNKANDVIKVVTVLSLYNRIRAAKHPGRGKGRKKSKGRYL